MLWSLDVFGHACVSIGKFKSGLQTESSTGLSVNELLDLLKTRDHSGEYRGGAGLGE